MAGLSLPHIWVLETLGQSDQTDINLLLGLLRKTPKASDPICKDVRELVALRILECLCLEEDVCDDTVASAIGGKEIVGVSESCEDVVIEVFKLLKQKDSHQRLSRVDLRCLIEHKRSNLHGKSSVEKIKDAILTGRISLSASSKKQGGLASGSHPENGCLLDNGSLSALSSTPNANEKNDETLLCRYLFDQNLLLGDRKRKRDTSNGLGVNNSIVGNDELPPNEKQGSHRNEDVRNHKSDAEDDHDAELDLEDSDKRSMTDKLVDSFERDSWNDGDNRRNSDISRDIDGCLEDINAKKKSFLSSQCKHDEDICVKCKEGGDLLVCSGISCRTVVHQRCLGLEAIFETGEEFYCPCCVCSQAEKKLFSARDHLKQFLSTIGAACAVGNIKRRKRDGQASQSPDQLQMHDLEDGGVVQNETTSSKLMGASDDKRFHDGTGANMEVLHPVVTRPPHEQKHSTSSQSGDREDGNKKPGIPTDEKQQLILPLIPSSRRDKRWSTEEKQALLE